MVSYDQNGVSKQHILISAFQANLERVRAKNVFFFKEVTGNFMNPPYIFT